MSFHESTHNPSTHRAAKSLPYLQAIGNPPPSTGHPRPIRCPCGSRKQLRFALNTQGRQDSNLQPPVLETGALPIELRPYCGAGYPYSPEARSGFGQRCSTTHTLPDRVWC